MHYIVSNDLTDADGYQKLVNFGGDRHGHILNNWLTLVVPDITVCSGTASEGIWATSHKWSTKNHEWYLTENLVLLLLWGELVGM